MAQGGYKNNFYDNVGGPIPILRMSTFGIGTKYYDKKVSFLPLVSALGINPTIWQNNNLYYNLQDEMMFYIDGNSQTGYVTSYNHGYPHLGHPNNHFHITPFEALYADEHTYDHIVMKKTVEEFDNTTEADLDRLRAFLISEIESFNFYLQNKIIGKNHVINSNYEYKAWYKASGTMFIGHNVTPKTNPGDYIIEPTGNITVYANNAVVIKPGFHAENGSTFHAFINGPPICDDSNRDKQTNNEQNQKEIVNKSFTIIQENYVNLDEAKLYPNPNTGQFIFEVNLINKKHNQLIIYTLTGQQVYAQQITKNKTLLNLNLDKGVYLVVYNNGEYNQNTKMIVQ
jgi:hypothetical protein